MNKTFASLLVTTLMLASAAHAEDKPAAAAKAAPVDAAAESKDYVMLKVDGEEIKKSEVDAAWKEAGKFIFQGRDVPLFNSVPDELKDKFLREMASERMLYKEAQKEGVENAPETQAVYETLKRQAAIQELLKQKTKTLVTDDKLQAAYETHIKEAVKANGGRDEIHIRDIMVKSKEAADAIEKKLKGGANFEKLAKEKSEDKNSGPQGGDMGWLDPDKVDKIFPEVAAVMFKLKKGEISAPVKTDFGWYIVKLEDWRALPPPPFADVKESLKQEVGNKAVGEYVKVLMKDVKIARLDASGHESAIPAFVAEKPAKDGKGDAAE